MFLERKMVDFCCIAVAAELWYVCVQRQVLNLYMRSVEAAAVERRTVAHIIGS